MQLFGVVGLMVVAGCGGSGSGGAEPSPTSMVPSPPAVVTAAAYWDDVGGACETLRLHLLTSYSEFLTNPTRSNRTLALKRGTSDIEQVIEIVRREVPRIEAPLRDDYRSQVVAPLLAAKAAAQRLDSAYRARDAGAFAKARHDLAVAEERLLSYGAGHRALSCSKPPVVP